MMYSDRDYPNRRMMPLAKSPVEALPPRSGVRTSSVLRHVSIALPDPHSGVGVVDVFQHQARCEQQGQRVGEAFACNIGSVEP